MESDDAPPSHEAPPPHKTTGRFVDKIRRSFKGESIDYTTGNLSRAVILLSIPMVLEMAMESLFAICDIFFVAKLGPDQVTAVGLTESWLTILYAVAMGLSMSTIAMVSRRIGAHKNDEAARAAQQAISLGVILSAMIAIIGGVFAPELLELMGAEAEVLRIGSTYARIMFSTNGVIFLLFLNNAVFRGAGDPVFAMRTLILANGINLILDPLLIFGVGSFSGLGLTGAAIATSIGRGTGVLYQIHHLRKGSGRINLGVQPWRLDIPLMRRLLGISLGGIGQFLVQTSSWIASIRLLSGFGTNAVAGYTIAIRIIMFAILPAFGLTNAAATLVGQCLGAGKPERAEKAVWLTGTYAMAFLGLISAVLIIGSNTFVSLFTSDQEVASIAAQSLTIICYGFVFYSWGMVTVQAFNGAGDTRTPTRVNLACFWFFQIPVAYVLAYPLNFGPSGVFWGIASSYSLSAVVGLVLFRKGRWKSIEV